MPIHVICRLKYSKIGIEVLSGNFSSFTKSSFPILPGHRQRPHTRTHTHREGVRAGPERIARSQPADVFTRNNIQPISNYYIMLTHL